MLSLVDLFIGLVAVFFLLLLLLFILIFFKIFLFIYFLSFFFSPFSSEPCDWQGLGAPAWCQVWASEVGEPSLGHWTTRDLLTPHNTNQREFSQRSLSQRQDPALPNGQQVPVLDAPCQTTSKTGTQPYPLAERLPKIILSSQTHQNTPPDMALPSKKTRSSPIHQDTGTSPLHQEAYTSYWTNLTYWGQIPKTMGLTNMQPTKRRHQTQ